MKTLKHLFTALLLLCSSVAFAHNFEVDGIYYKVTNSTAKEVEVTYKGNSYSEYSNEYTGNVVIPDNVVYNDVTYSVTSIGVYAFYDCRSLTSVEIPNSVTSIGYEAFRNCFDLPSVAIGNSVTSIGERAFYDCTGLASIEIPTSVTSIGVYAFYNCRGLTSIEIPNSVTSIGSYAFENCSSLASIEIGNSVTSIGHNAFYKTPWYNNQPDGVVYAGTVLYKYKGTMPFGASIAIKDGTTTIGNSAFSGYSGLTCIEIPTSVTSIGEDAFYGCSDLTSIEIPNSVTSIDNNAFYGCISLKELRIEEGETTLSLGYNQYGNARGLFCDCPLETLYLGRDLSYNTGSFSYIPFHDNETLTSVTIGNSVTRIDNNTFNGCISLKELRIEDGESTLSLGYNNYNKTGGLFCACPLETLYLGRDLSYNTGSTSYIPFYDNETLTSVTIGNSVTSIGNYAFENCSSLASIEIGNSVTSIGKYAFKNCSSLASIEFGNSVTSIGNYAFENCSSLASIEIGNSVTSIGDYAFSGTPWYNNQPDGVVYAGKVLYKYKGTMPANTSIVIKEGTTTIGYSAFSGCSALVSVEIPNSVKYICDNAFKASNTVFEFAAEEPATLESSVFHSNAVLVVPDAAVDTYKAAWSGYEAQIVGSSDALVTVDVEAMDATSGIMESLGVNKVGSVAKLTVKGSINSYDVIQFRDKMPMLRELDLSEAAVVASDKAFYNGNCTKDNNLGDYAFYNLSKLNFVKLPKDLVAVGNYMFYGCSSLSELEIPETVQSIGSYAFNSCSSLEEIAIPDGVTSLQSYTFYGCSNLKKVTLPDGLESIGYYAFRYCYALKEIKLPPTVKTIGSEAFYGCSALEEIRIPSSVESIGSSAFGYCNKLSKVYTYTVEPTAIQESTFSTFATATLYVPSVSFSNYYWDDGWKRFLNLEEFNEPYEYFYVNNDYTLNDDTGYIEGTEGNAPDADINAGGGFIVEGEQGDDETPNQSLGDVNVGSNGEGTSGSIIGDNNLHIDDLHIKITVKGGRWYFFAFPFDIFFKDITMENGSDYVFRYYDGEERANKGNGGWKDINENHLKAARGYIFQCSANDVLVLNIKDVKFKKEDKYNELVAHVSENLKDASWNFVGNPYLSYYDLADMDYSAPVTVWDGSKYVAIRPGDDDYHFAPYEAFFVQKPENQDEITFDGQEQMTKNQSNKQKEKQAAARRARGIDPERLLINLVLGNGTSDDRTRIVFNERQSLAYETACDATKFETAGVAQLYTIGSDKVHYAINERPADNGVVMLGYTAPVAGFYTIEAQRMDAEVFVKDYKTGTLHNLKDGAYSFGTDAGTFNDRFEILLKGTAPGTTGIDEVKAENGEVKGEIYDLQGRKMQDAGKGIYIIDGEKVMK